MFVFHTYSKYFWTTSKCTWYWPIILVVVVFLILQHLTETYTEFWWMTSPDWIWYHNRRFQYLLNEHESGYVPLEIVNWRCTILEGVQILWIVSGSMSRYLVDLLLQFIVVLKKFSESQARIVFSFATSNAFCFHKERRLFSLMCYS
jgi:hypothetical protein